jgi:TetR/AcrR family transcriptional regulator, regulator of cefoperazone and chloramphenicol sensitivity
VFEGWKVAPDDTQTRLLEAAGQVFAEKGFQDATVRRICERAGVNIAAINYHFGDKEQLYVASVRHAFQCRLESMPIPNWPPGTPPAQKLRDFIHVVVDRMCNDHYLPWQWQLLMRELSQPSQAGESIVRDFIGPVYGLLRGILQEALPGEVDEVKLHLTAFSIMGQCFYHRVARPIIRLVVGEEEHARYVSRLVADHIADFTLAALGLAPPHSGDTP